MIKLPKEVVSGLVTELKHLVEMKENTVTQEDLDAIKNHNLDLENKITERQNLIKAFQSEIEDLKAKFKPIPTQEPVDETKIEDLITMLILSGYYVKVQGEDGEYLVETDAYEEKVEQPVIEETLEVEKAEEVIALDETNPEEVINVEEK